MKKYLFLPVLILSICPSVFALEVVKQKWVARYNGPENSVDCAVDLAADSSGNVYVTGYSYGTDGINSDYATIKYDPNGSQLWAARYNGPDNFDDIADSLAVDNSGNVYVTGNSYDSNGYSDYVTIKYDLNGNQLWAKSYDGNDYDGPYAIAVDGIGNVYVTGYSYINEIGSNCTTIKYSPDGNQLWVAIYNGPDNGDDYVYDLAVDGSGNIYITGYSYSNDTFADYTTVKYDPNGNQLWVAHYNGPDNSDDSAVDLAVDSFGNVYVTGYSYGADGVNSDYATIKYNTSGTQQWVSRYNGPDNSDDVAVALAIDNSVNVYVTGSSYGGTGQDYATVKYGPDGNQLWVARYNGPANSDDDVAIALKVDSSGNVYVTGYSVGEGTSFDYATIKYDPNGNQLWVLRYNGPGNDSDVASALALDNSGNVYATGYSYDSSTATDYATIKYKQISCTSPIPGDLNNDCKVDLDDLAIMVSHWLECNYLPEENCW